MHKFMILKRVSRTIIAVIILLALATGCIQNTGDKGQIPITTQSIEAQKIFLEGRQLFENLRIDEARELFSQALETDPDFVQAHLYRSLSSETAMNSEQHLQKAMSLAMNASEGEQLLVAAVMAAEHGNPSKEIELLEQLVQNYPRDVRAHYFLASTYDAQHELDKAIAEFQKLLKIDPNYSRAYNHLGYAYRDKGDFEKASEAFKRYVELIPDEANPYDSMGDLYTKMGEYDKAIESYQKAIDLNPSFAFSQRNIGTNLVFLGKYDEARDAYRKALEMEPTAAGKIIDMRMIAYAYIYQSDFENAIKHFDKAFDMAIGANIPEQQAQIYYAKCRVHLEANRFDNAKQSLAACSDVVAKSELSEAAKFRYEKNILYEMARIASKQKDFDRATTKAAEYKVKVEEGYDPDQIKSYYALLGHISIDKGNYAKAIEHFRQANQKNPYTLYLLGVSETEAGDASLGVELFKKVANWNESSLDYAFVRSKAMARTVMAVN
mgnify:CR=1 FL=1